MNKNKFTLSLLLNLSFAFNANAENIFLHFPEKAEIQKAEMIIDRTSRVQFVYDHLRQRSLIDQKEISDFLESKDVDFKNFYIQNSILVKDAKPELIEQILKLNPLIQTSSDISINLMKKIPAIQTRDFQNQNTPSHLKRLKIPEVWQQHKTRGYGIVLGNQDTGFLWYHQALKKQYRGFSELNIQHPNNWLDAFGQYQAPTDDDGHGTHTLGSMLGDDGGKNLIGAAPEAQWIGCRNMKKGVGTVSSYLTCFEFFLAPYPPGSDPRTDGNPALAPHIINNSWSCPRSEGCQGDEFLQALQAHKAAGILNVVAAGNDGPNCGTISESPAKYVDLVLIVGSYSEQRKNVSSFSNRGPSGWNKRIAPDVMAFGEGIRSSLSSDFQRYGNKTGTSMAAPQIAGGIALLWSARPSLIGNIDYTIELVRKSAEPLTSNQSCGGTPGSDIPNSTMGYGMADFLKALELHDQIK